MLSVCDIAVTNEGMHDAVERVRHCASSKKVATFAYCMLGRENSVRRIGTHVTEKY